MTDAEFIEAIKDRIRRYGHTRGSIGIFDGAGCLLGHAGYAQHGDTLKTAHDDGVNPIEVDGRSIDLAGIAYDEIPGMRRIAKLLGFAKPWDVAIFSDGIDRDMTTEEVIATFDEALAAVEA